MKIKFKLLLLTLVLLISSMAIVPSAQAGYWGEPIMASMLKQMMEKIADTIQGMIMGALKEAAAQNINSTVNSLISGGGMGSAGFIQDWDHTLFRQPAIDTELELDDIFEFMVRGKSSSSNYTSSSGLTIAPRIRSSEFIGPQIDRDQYCDGSKFSWSCYAAIATNPANTASGRELYLEGERLRIAEEKQQAEAIKAIAYGGFTGTETADGITVTPGSVTEGIAIDAQTLGSKILSDAESIPEVIVATLTRLVSKTIQSGIGNARRNIQKEINNTTGKFNSEISKKVPNELFKPSF